MSGKPHRKMPERAVLLKGFRMPRKVSEKLIYSARRQALLPILTAGLRAAKHSADGCHLRRSNYRQPSFGVAFPCLAFGMVLLDALFLRMIFGHTNSALRTRGSFACLR